MMRRYLAFGLAALVLSACSFAQTGTPPFASFSQNQFSALNNGNLNSIFTIPVMSSPGRGLSLNVNAVYNSQVWFPAANGGGGLAWTPFGGWLLTSPIGYVTYQATTTTGSCGRLGEGFTQTTIYTGYVYTDALGTLHGFGTSLFVREFYNSCTDTTTYSGTYSGFATDLSGYHASISNPAVSLIPMITSKSGVQISTSDMKVTDANGNFVSGAIVSGSETDWTDSAGRLALKVITSGTSVQYKFLDPTGAYQTTTVYLTPTSVKTNFGCS